jgi:hypothetical protein
MKDVKGDKKSRKQRPQQAAATAGRDDDDDGKQADSSYMECITSTRRSVKRHVRPPTDHFKRLLKEACHNHAYPVEHKLMDCGMMKNFMITGSLDRDMEP